MVATVRLLRVASLCAALAGGVVGPALAGGALSPANAGAAQKLDRVAALAAGGEEKPPAPASASVLWVLVSLALVVGLIYVAGRAMRGGFARRAAQGGAISVLASRQIGPQTWLYLVDTLDSVLLVGATSGTMVLLREVPEGQVAARLRENAKADSGAFSAMLAAARGGRAQAVVRDLMTRLREAGGRGAARPRRPRPYSHESD